jgi:hypothetical protein
METIVWSVSRNEASTEQGVRVLVRDGGIGRTDGPRERWPAWRAPIVGTNPTEAPLREAVQARTAATVVRMGKGAEGRSDMVLGWVGWDGQSRADGRSGEVRWSWLG